MGKQVTVFGSFVVDLTARTPRLPVPGETVKGLSFHMGPGGKGFNQAVAAHKAGAAMTLVTKVGADAFADVAAQTMQELHMDSRYVFRTAETSSGAALISVNAASSQNEIVVVPGACGTLTKQEVDAALPAILQSEYLLLQLEVNQDANEYLAEQAHRAGVKIILNPAPYQPVDAAFLQTVYMLTPNETEAGAMVGFPVTDEKSAAAAAAVLHEMGIAVVCITMGDKGAYLSDGRAAQLIPAFCVPAVDTTGAGDGFNGGLLTALAEGRSLHDAVVFASALSALSVQREGTAPSMPWRQEIDAFLRLQDA